MLESVRCTASSHRHPNLLPEEKGVLAGLEFMREGALVRARLVLDAPAGGPEIDLVVEGNDAEIADAAC